MKAAVWNFAYAKAMKAVAESFFFGQDATRKEGRKKMQRKNLILAALAAGGEGADFTPVQVQKLFFLIDREAAPLVDGPHFDFEPYDYGPFDRSVYVELDALETLGFVRIASAGKYRRYALTADGFKAGSKYLSAFPAKGKAYVQRVALWVRKLNFAQLVAAIYKQYPDMRANSIFNG